MPTVSKGTGGLFATRTTAAANTETDYATQNALGLAKIAQINPLLAQSMQRAYESRTQHSESLLSGMWNAVSSPLKRGLEFLGNIGSAAAEPFRQEEENDNPLKDVWQGLTGQENTTWSTNLVSYGADKDAWTTRVAGLAGDIFLDPTNYIGAGGLGLARDTIATGAKDIAEHTTLSLLKKRVAKDGGLRVGDRLITDADDLPTVFADVSREEFRNMNVSDELIDAMTGIAAGNADRTLLRGLDDLIQHEARWMGERFGSAVLQRKSIRQLPAEIISPTGMRWKRDDFIKVFEDTSKLNPEQMHRFAQEIMGEGVGRGTSGMLGRRSAAALGGVRLKFGIPFSERLANAYDKPWLGYRWQTNAVPLLHRFKIFGSGEGAVANKMGDFFRGVSGINRLDTAIQQSITNGDGLWKQEDMQKFLRLGFTKFEHKMIDEGRGASFRSLFGNKATTMFMSASDRMGGLTANLTPKAQLWRRVGYTGMKAGQELRNAAVMKKLYREFASEYESDWARASHKLEKMVAKGELDGDAVRDRMISYLEGADNLSELPDFLRLPAKQMKAMYPKLLKEAKKHGAAVGDITEVFARKRSDLALDTYTKELDTITKQYQKLTQDLAGEKELLSQEVGEAAAAGMKSPKQVELEQKILETQSTLNKILESRKSIELEIGMMDDYDNLIRHIRPNYPGEKALPKAYFHRRMTTDAREAIRGSLQAQYKHWGKAKQVSAQLERILAHMDHTQAADYLRKVHPEALKNVKKIWEDNPFGVYAAYVEDLSEAVYKSQLRGSAEHVMGLLGAVDNGLAMRVTAHIPKEYYPRNAAADAVKARGGVAEKFQNLHDLIDRVHMAIGAKVVKSAHAEGTAVWAGREPWKDKALDPSYPGTLNDAEYMDIDDVADIQIPTEKLRAQVEGTAHIKDDIKQNGWKEPIILDVNFNTGKWDVGNGHHRLLAARELVEEGFEEARYIPVTIRPVEWKAQHPVDLEQVMPGIREAMENAHRQGTNFDWDEVGFLPGYMRPSEFFAHEAGRLGKVGSLTEEEGAKLGIALHEMNRAKTQAHGMVAEPEVAFKKLEADVDGQMWGKLDIPGLEDFAMHPFMAAEFNRAYQGLQSLPQWRRNWRQFVMGPWKKAATIYFPGFHARNFMGAWYNNFLGGVSGTPGIKSHGATGYYDHSDRIMDVLRHGDKSQWASKTYAKGIKIDGEVVDNLTYRDLSTILMSRGIVGGNNLAVADLRSFLGRSSSSQVRGKRTISSRLAVGKLGKYQSKTLGEVTYAEQLMRQWEEWGIRTTNTTENYFRTAAFLKGLEDAGGDTAGARSFVMMRHGDYDELTDFENGIRDLVPFYKWMRTNLPFQIKRLFEDPAKQLATLDAQNALIPEDERKEWQTYMREGLAIPMPKGLTKLLGGKEGGGILMAQLPLHDVYISSNEFTSSLLPVVRQVVETGVLKKSLFTGAPLEGTQMVEAAGWMQTTGLASLLQAVGIGEEGPDGKVFFSDREMNLANMFPIFARSRSFLTEDPDRRNLRYAAFISSVAGMRPEQIGEQELNEGEREWYYDVLQPQLTQLTEMGYKLPTAYDLGLAANQGGGGLFGRS